MYNLYTVIAEGKTKQIIDIGGDQVLIRSKDDITAGNGKRRDLMNGKAIITTTTTCNVFKLLNRNGIATHYVDRIDATTFLARKVKMIPIELVVRRIATGSYLKRNPGVEEGIVFTEMVTEMFDKDDENNDLMLSFDFTPGKECVKRFRADLPCHDGLISDEPLSISRYNWITIDILNKMRLLGVRTFIILSDIWSMLGGTLYDFKIECGFDIATNQLLVADVIDNDSWRLRFNGQSKDKDNYRKGLSLADVKKDYQEVAKMTEKFADINLKN